MNTAERLELALHHAAQGRAIFPFRLGPKAGADQHRPKTPLVKWQDGATTDEATIRDWWTNWPTALPGWRLPLGHVVLDVDDPEQFDAAGLELDRTTASQLTPSAGYHLLYLHDPERAVRQTVKEVPGADTRVGGKGWVGLYDFDAFEKPAQDCPEWLYDARSGSTSEPEPDSAADDSMGTRPEILAWLGMLRRARSTQPEMLAALHAARESGRIVALDELRPWTDKDLETLSKEAAKWAPETAGWTGVTINRVSRKTRHEAPRSPESAGIDAVDLLAKSIPPLVYIVDGLIPQGTTILAAEPKIGKSWLAYQMCVEVALGGDVLNRSANQGSALYYALEDGERRGQDRLKRALHGRAIPRGRLEVRWSSPKIGNGLEEEIEAWLDAHEDAALVVIDTLQKARPAGNGKRGMYEVDVEDLGKIQNIFRDRPVGLVIVHHTRKAKADDFLSSVSGSYGVTGSADTTAVLKRKRLEVDGTLDVTSRDAAEVELAVKFDIENGLWTATDRPSGMSSLDVRIWEWLAENGPAFPSAIARDMDEIRESVARAVAGMVEEGQLIQGKGGYSVPVMLKGKARKAAHAA